VITPEESMLYIFRIINLFYKRTIFACTMLLWILSYNGVVSIGTQTNVLP